jgi:ferredoxin--NADP+ reductase
MHTVTLKQKIAPQVWRYSILAPDVARNRLPGHFIILRPTVLSERIPLTIVSSHPTQGSIDIIFQVVGATTSELAELEVGQAVADLAGPLGHPTHIENFGRTVIVGGGVGIAPLLPIAQALHRAGNALTSILGARSAEHLILADELAPISRELVITTDDGSRGEKGFVTQPLTRICEQGSADFVLAVGPVMMMKAVAETTRPYGIKTMVSLNPLMIDGTGMCGVCRCKVGSETKFACVDGPEFDGHQVDFESLSRRLRMYKSEEEQKRKSKGAEACR